MIYTKQAISLSQQIETLRQRGLIIDNEGEALRALESISYFRLADYWFSMEADHCTHTFQPDSHFNTVMCNYNFDRELKIMLFSAIQAIEVAARAKVIKHIATTCGPFWFMDETKAVNRHHFEQNLDKVRKEVARSRERYIREHFRKYTEPDLPPVWKTLEVVSLGILSKLFNNLNESELKHLVAHDFGLNHHRFLTSWLESLTALRNYCAHHARIWNRAYPVKPAMPETMPNEWITDFSFPDESLYAHLSCIAYWLNAIESTNTFAHDVKALLTKYHTINPSDMGFPANWRQEPLWS